MSKRDTVLLIEDILESALKILDCTKGLEKTRKDRKGKLAKNAE